MAISTNEFINNQKRQKPVILILDTSGSMDCEGRIDQLNRGVRGLLTDLAKIRSASVEMCISIIEFGGDNATLAVDYTKLRDVRWTDLRPHGCTPLGSALMLAKDIIEDKSKLSTNAYRPTVILMSDGIPTDDYEEAMVKFTTTGRTAKCDRFVAAVQGADENVLACFVKDKESHFFRAENAGDICEFMKFMSSSIVNSSTNSDKNKTPVKDIQCEVKEEAKNLDDDWGNDLGDDVFGMFNGMMNN